jgi:hypothetical protein
MSKMVTVMLIHHRHKSIDIIYSLLVCRESPFYSTLKAYDRDTKTAILYPPSVQPNSRLHPSTSSFRLRSKCRVEFLLALYNALYNLKELTLPSVLIQSRH